MSGDRIRYRGSVEYTAQTVRKMEKIRYRTFSFITSLVRIVCGAVMVVSGYFTGGSWGTLFVAFGCILAVSGDVVGRWRCDQTVKAMGGRTIHVDYEFADQEFVSVTGRERLSCAYRDIICLMEDESSYYLYPNEHQVYMLQKETLRPSDREGFRRFLSERCRVEWLKPLSLLTVNLKQIIQFQKTLGKKRSA